jgi:hypothetical protein
MPSHMPYSDLFVNYYISTDFSIVIKVKHKYKLDVHGSVHRNINLLERTNKMPLCGRIYYSSVSLIAQHVLGDTSPIMRSSKTVIAASGFTFVFGCRPSQRPATKNVSKTRGCNYSFWAPDDGRLCRPKHVEQLRNNRIINSTTQWHLVGSFCEIHKYELRVVTVAEFSFVILNNCSKWPPSVLLHVQAGI